jgi:hypothetical protein
MIDQPIHNNDVNVTIWARDNNTMARLDLIERWLEFHVDLKWADMSTWSLKLPAQEFIDAFQLTGTAATTLVGNFSIAAYRNNELLPLIAGPVTSATEDWNGADDIITLNGMSDDWWLTAKLLRPAWNTFFSNDGYYSGYTRYSGFENKSAEEVMKSFLYYWFQDMQGGQPPTLYFQIPYFNGGFLGNPVMGSNMTMWGRWQSAFQMCKDACMASTGTAARNYQDADMHFEVLNIAETGSLRLLFMTYVADDISTQVTFGSDLGTVRSYSYTENRPSGNVIYGGGPDFDPVSHTISQEIGFRLYHLEWDGQSIDTYGNGQHGAAIQPGRIEEFFDCGSVQSDSPTQAKIVAAMGPLVRAELKKQKVNATVTINLEPSDMVDFGTLFNNTGDFRLGSKVAVQLNHSLTLTDVIREVKADFDPDKGEIITPIVCDPMKFYYTRPVPFAYANRWKLGEIGRNWK